MIISFILFIGFVLFIFIYINPINLTQKNNIFIDEIQRKIIENINAEIGRVSIITNEDDGCYKISLLTNAVEIREDSRKYTLYISEIFDNLLPHYDEDCNKNNYNIGVNTYEEIVIYEFAKKMKEDYDNDYERLKESLNIKDDFLFRFRNFEGEYIDEISISREPPEGVNVNAFEFPVRVINKEGQINEFILNIRAW